MEYMQSIKENWDSACSSVSRIGTYHTWGPGFELKGEHKWDIEVWICNSIARAPEVAAEGSDSKVILGYILNLGPFWDTWDFFYPMYKNEKKQKHGRIEDYLLHFRILFILMRDKILNIFLESEQYVYFMIICLFFWFF